MAKREQDLLDAVRLGRGYPHVQPPPSNSSRVHLLCRQCTITLDFFLVFCERADRVVEEISLEPSGFALEAQRFVNNSGKLFCSSAIKAPLTIRIPSGMCNPAAQVQSTTGKLIDFEFGRLELPFADRAPQFRTQLFVGIERQNPVVRRRARCKILLGRKIGPRVYDDLRCTFPCDLPGSILTPAIHNHNLVGNRLN